MNMPTAASLCILAVSLSPYPVMAGPWSSDCDEASRCVVSKFVTDPSHANLDVGAIFSSDDGVLNLRIIAPLGLDVSKGVFLDLDKEELGVAPIRACPPAGCVADIALSALDFVPFSTANELGITIWELDGRPFRLGMSLAGLQQGVEKIFNFKPNEGVVIANWQAVPKITGVANVSFNMKSHGGLSNKWCQDKYAGLYFVISDEKAIEGYIRKSNEYVAGEIRKIESHNNKKASNLKIYEDVALAINHAAKEYAGKIDIEGVSIDTREIDIEDGNCSPSGFYALQKSYPNDIPSSAGIEALRAAHNVSWISELSLKEGGSAGDRPSLVGATPISEYAIKVFSSAVMQRALDEKYGQATKAKQ